MEKDLILITAYCDNNHKEDVLRNLVKQINEHSEKFDIFIVSHTPIPQDISERANFAFYDKKNELLHDWDLRCKPWFDPNNERPILSIFTGNYNTHLAIWRMIILGNMIAKNCGYKKVHHLEFDSDIKDFSEFYENSDLLEKYDSVIYNKIVSTVDPILFGTYQAYRVDKLPNELLFLDENKIKNEIRESDHKSPEIMLFELLTQTNNYNIKLKDKLDSNGNELGMSHNKLSNGNTAWCVPYYDRLTHKLGFVIWNMEQTNQDIKVSLLYNDEKVVNFGIVSPGHWRLIDLGDYSNAKKLVVLHNDKIRNIFEFDKYREEFKNSSFRENFKRS
jgi:hypothetical protein